MKIMLLLHVLKVYVMLNNVVVTIFVFYAYFGCKTCFFVWE